MKFKSALRLVGLGVLWFIGALVSSEVVVGNEPTNTPHWIWPPDTATEAESTFVLGREFVVPLSASRASLKIAADFCFARVYLNDDLLFAVEPYSETIEFDVRPWIRVGQNNIRIEVDKVPGPSAIAASVAIQYGNDKDILISTDSTWSCRAGTSAAAAKQPPQSLSTVTLGQVRPELWGVNRRSPKVDATENYEQWRSAVAGSSTDKFWTAPGFEITALRAAQPDEGSWVSMAFDEQGRLTIAREERGLLRMTLNTSEKNVGQVEVINDSLLECRGLLYAHQSLFANANNSKGLYRLRDLDGNGSFEDIRMMREFPGSVGHGRNDIALAPDGDIFAIHGDSVNVPQADIIDRTSPLRDRLRGSSPGQGHVVRTDTEGKRWEVICSGLRNPFGIAVNDLGDWFTYDADAEFDMGSPWYRPTRVVQLLSGADYGWRSVTGKWPPYFPDHPDNAMPTLDIGKGSPTAVLFPYQAKFPESYRRSLMILDWTYGRILAVHLAPRGAGYRAAAETFVQGKPLNVTDLAVGPDGALYVITGGRKTQSTLYRIAYIGSDLNQQTSDSQDASNSQLHELACSADARQSKLLRTYLESLHQRGREATKQELQVAWVLLDSDDWTLRHAARVGIEHQAVHRWSNLALAEDRPNALIEAALALSRTGDRQFSGPILDKLLKVQPKSLTLSQLWGLCQCYSMLASFAGPDIALVKDQIVLQLANISSVTMPHIMSFGRCGTGLKVQGEIAVLLSEIQARSSAVAVANALLIRPEQEARLHGLFAARLSDVGWTLNARRQYFQALNEGENFLRGEGMNKFLTQIRTEATTVLTQAERDNLADVLVPQSQKDLSDEIVINRPIKKQWTMNDLVPLLADTSRLGDSKNGQKVFQEAQCNRCHRSGARGPAVGPELTHVSSRFNRKDILLSVIEPSQVVAENYRSLKIITTDGRTLVGRAIMEGDYRSDKLRLATNPLRLSEVTELDKRDIEESSESPISPMPSGLLDTFEAHEIIDLLEFLISGSHS